MTPITRAFAQVAGAVSSLRSLPTNSTDAECEPFHVIIDEARTVIKTSPASGPAELAIKLRTALAGIDQKRADELILYRVVESEDLPSADYFEQIVWTVIRDLEGEVA